jgi:hypothetical protein
VSPVGAGRDPASGPQGRPGLGVGPVDEPIGNEEYATLRRPMTVPSDDGGPAPRFHRLGPVAGSLHSAMDGEWAGVPRTAVHPVVDGRRPVTAETSVLQALRASKLEC